MITWHHFSIIAIDSWRKFEKPYVQIWRAVNQGVSKGRFTLWSLVSTNQIAWNHDFGVWALHSRDQCLEVFIVENGYMKALLDHSNRFLKEVGRNFCPRIWKAVNQGASKGGFTLWWLVSTNQIVWNYDFGIWALHNRDQCLEVFIAENGYMTALLDHSNRFLKEVWRNLCPRKWRTVNQGAFEGRFTLWSLISTNQIARNYDFSIWGLHTKDQCLEVFTFQNDYMTTLLDHSNRFSMEV